MWGGNVEHDFDGALPQVADTALAICFSVVRAFLGDACCSCAASAAAMEMVLRVSRWVRSLSASVAFSVALALR